MKKGLRDDSHTMTEAAWQQPGTGNRDGYVVFSLFAYD
jgi:hypothetical protein